VLVCAPQATEVDISLPALVLLAGLVVVVVLAVVLLRRLARRPQRRSGGRPGVNPYEPPSA
jgi:hypothetical protein